MSDTGKEQKTGAAEEGPAEEETAANNNVEETAEERAAAEAEELSREARLAALEAELAEQKDRLLRALAPGPPAVALPRRSYLAGVSLVRGYERHQEPSEPFARVPYVRND